MQYIGKWFSAKDKKRLLIWTIFSFLYFKIYSTDLQYIMRALIFYFPTELIYEEVIDWEERNKNGLMKEDCSGTYMHYLQSLSAFSHYL